MPALPGGGTPMVRNRCLLWDYGRRYDYLFPSDQGACSPNLTVRESGWKLLIDADGTGTEPYDFKADSDETNDLTSRSPKKWRV